MKTLNRKVIGPGVSESFAIQVTRGTDKIKSGSTTSTPVKDLKFTTTSDVRVDKTATVQVTLSGPRQASKVSVLNPQVEVIKNGNSYSFNFNDTVEDGHSQRIPVLVKTGIGTKKCVIDLATGVPSSQLSNVLGFTEGSLAHHIASSLRGMINGKVSGNDTQFRYLSAVYSDVGCTAILNPNAFCASLNFDATAIYRHTSNPQTSPPYAFSPHLISPSHILTSKHVGMWVGCKVYFRRNDGSTHSAIVTKVENLPDNMDLTVGLLDVPVTGVTPYRVLPDDWADYIPAMIVNGSTSSPKICIPAITKGVRQLNDPNAIDPSNRFKVTFLRINSSDRNQISVLNNPSGTSNNTLVIDQTLEDFFEWFDGIDGGDSGSATCVPINGEAVLVCLQWTHSGGPMIQGEVKTQIDLAMNTLSGTTNTHQLQVVDLGSFPKYD